MKLKKRGVALLLAALRFIPYARLEAEDYGYLLSIFEE